jgi:hypothetical protein
VRPTAHCKVDEVYKKAGKRPSKYLTRRDVYGGNSTQGLVRFVAPVYFTLYGSPFGALAGLAYKGLGHSVYTYSIRPDIPFNATRNDEK